MLIHLKKTESAAVVVVIRISETWREKKVAVLLNGSKLREAGPRLEVPEAPIV